MHKNCERRLREFIYKDYLTSLTSTLLRVESEVHAGHQNGFCLGLKHPTVAGLDLNDQGLLSTATPALRRRSL